MAKFFIYSLKTYIHELIPEFKYSFYDNKHSAIVQFFDDVFDKFVNPEDLELLTDPDSIEEAAVDYGEKYEISQLYDVMNKLIENDDNLFENLKIFKKYAVIKIDGNKITASTDSHCPGIYFDFNYIIGMELNV